MSAPSQVNRSPVDEIQRRVGRNLLMFQAAEQSLRFILPYIHPDGSRNGADAMRQYADDYVSHKTLGPLIEQFKEAAATGDKQLVADELEAFVEARNELVHQFYRRFDLTKPDAIGLVLTYLDQQYESTRAWAELFRAHAGAVLLALAETSPKLAAELEPYREKLMAPFTTGTD